MIVHFFLSKLKESRTWSLSSFFFLRDWIVYTVPPFFINKKKKCARYRIIFSIPLFFKIKKIICWLYNPTLLLLQLHSLFHLIFFSTVIIVRHLKRSFTKIYISTDQEYIRVSHLFHIALVSFIFSFRYYTILKKWKKILLGFYWYFVLKNEYATKQCVLPGEILNTSMGVDHSIDVACTICIK
jgi:hypothetical protein